MLHETILAEAKGFPDRAIRQVTVLVNAGIAQGGRDGLCRVRNVSEGGLTIETSVPLTVGEGAVVSFHTGQELACTVRWAEGGRAGMSCQISPISAINVKRHEVPGPTLPRFSRTARTEVVVLGVPYRCSLDSISTRDVLATRVPIALKIGQLLSVDIDGLGALPASVQIAEDGELFARFAPALSFAKLDAWLARDL